MACINDALLVIQTGGTIDKAYPSRLQGYAFEIDEPAARRVIEAACVGFGTRYEVRTDRDR
jgi:hypothetical protein